MRIGLTGGMGCGKSTVLALLKERGWHVVSTDAIARDLLESDAGVIEAVTGHFAGRGVVREGRIDRGALAAIVFAESAELSWLEALLHPRIHRIWLAGLPASGYAVVEIPLLFEKDLAALFDYTVCVEGDSATVNDRLRDRGLTSAQIEARSSRQWPLARKIEAADFVVSNNATREALIVQVDALVQRLAFLSANR